MTTYPEIEQAELRKLEDALRKRAEEMARKYPVRPVPLSNEPSVTSDIFTKS